jgi:uncharacterized membrane protein
MAKLKDRANRIALHRGDHPVSAAGQASIVKMESSQVHLGPIPDPATLAGYGAIQPDFPERILKMAEGEAAHRRGIDNKLVEGRLRIESRGQAYALVIALFGIGAGATAVLLGHDVAGATLGGVSLVSIVGAFIHGNRRTTAEPKK